MTRVTILFNPPRHRRRRRAKTGRAVARLLRAAKKRKKKAKSKRSGSMATKRKRSRRKTGARKAAATRARKRARRSRAGKKAAATRRRRRGGGRRRRSSARKTRSRSRRRPSSRRRRTSRRRSTAKRGRHRPTVYYKKGRGFYQKRRGRLGLKGHRVNPPLVPTMGSVTNILKDGAAVVGGYAGVNLMMYGAEMVGVSKLYGSQSPIVQALIKTVLRIGAVGVVVKLSGFVTKRPETRRMILAGAAGNVVMHAVRDFAGGSLPETVNNLLLGDGVGDYLTTPGLTTMGDWMPAQPGSPFGSSLLPAPVASEAFI